MTVIGLHPEELLDRASRGTLVGSDRERLEAHLATCAACRLELALRDDFAEELEAPAARISGSVAEALGRIAAEAPLSPRAELVETPVAGDLVARIPGGSGRGRRLVVLLVAAAALLVGGVAGAAGLAGVLRTFSVVTPATIAPSTTVAPAPTPVRALGHGRPVAAPASAAAEPSPIDPGVVEPAVVVPVIPDVAVRASSVPDVAVPSSLGVSPGRERASSTGPDAARATVPADAPRDAASPPAASAPAPTAIVADAGAPARLFAEANEARRRGEIERAVTLYRELERRHPDTEEAKVARATVGRLLLERGDAASALDRFDAYLDRSRGVLTEDAMVGRAESLARLGRGREEAAAWSALLAKYPGSAHAARAKARLSELGSR